ncbi:GTPase [Microtetraspora malaysiensis]|uniref:GTPase n=1 Tax=Microtetraspora malaysiensis TaxID=161358 RepID=UPI003D8CE3AA
MKLKRRRATLTLDDRLAALAEATDLAEGRLEHPLVERARAVVARAGTRSGLSVDHTAVALAGATGSGKSSLFNALVGTPLADVGVTRPMTAHAQAALWEGGGAGPLLDWFEVPRRHSVDGGDLSGLILLDLPDHDSIELAHRLEVDRLVAIVDLLVWVLDPQKYADAAVHERYLRPLAQHRDVMLVVLNQIDRLPRPAVRRCLADLRELLAADGLSGVRVVAVSALTGEGLPELREALSGLVSRRTAWAARLAADAAAAATVLAGFDDAAPEAAPGAATPFRRLGTVPPQRRAAERSARWQAGERARRWERPPRRPGEALPGREAGEMPTVPPAGLPEGRRWPARSSPGAAEEALVEALQEAAAVPLVVQSVAKAHRHRSVAATGWPVTRWLRRLRPDPLRRLHIGGVPGTPGRTSVPAATAVQRSQVDTAIREVGARAARETPEPWAAAVRHAARSHLGELGDEIDMAVARTSFGASRRPRWWQAVGALQWLVFAVLVAGAAWLLALFAVAALMLPAPPTPKVGQVPWPTVLLVGAAVVGVAVALVSRLAAWLGGRRRARRTARALRASIDAVARRLVLAPVREELDRYRRFLALITIVRSR